MKKYFPELIVVLSLVFLGLGITQPLLTIKASVNKQEMFDLASESFFSADQGNSFIQGMLQPFIQKLNFEGTVQVFESTRSLLGTMTHLIESNHLFVGLLIGIFGIIIPVIKLVLITYSSITKSQEKQEKLLKISGLLSKWSMSDVFVMAVFIAFLAMNANEDAINTVQMNAELGNGFYYFAVYCLLSIFSSQLMEKR